MKTQLMVGLAIVVLGGALVGGEVLLVRWYPRHQQRVAEGTLTLLPYQNESLGVDLQVASGFYGKIETLPNGVKIYRPRLFHPGPSLTITSQTNPDGSFEFTPQTLAIWQTDGVTHNIPRYNFEHLPLNGRDAVLIWQWKNKAMWMTARIISPGRIIEANCTPGGDDEQLYLQACDETLHTIKVSGPMPATQQPVMELLPKR